MKSQATYRGRFAPSPSGELHFGSLIAAVGSYLQAKHQQGQWLIRIDDIDPTRVQKGAADKILSVLEGFGFEWDEEVLYQSSKHHYYQEFVDSLVDKKRAYPCSCSRKSILSEPQYVHENGNVVYPGLCRNGALEKLPDYAIRLRCEDTVIQFTDKIRGPQKLNIGKDIGDFILQRRDHFFSYHLATGIDDIEQNITEVVRGGDLLSTTYCQLHIQQSLALPSPQYCHLPIMVNSRGQKLSKQTHAKPIRHQDSVILLYKSLKFLGQMPPIYLMEGNQEDIWCWAKKNWQLELVPKIAEIKYELETINK